MLLQITLFVTMVGCALALPHATSYASVTLHNGNHGYYGGVQGLYYPHAAPLSTYGDYGHYDGLYGGDYYGDDHDDYHHPQYAYKYGVDDPHTHDIKSHEEHRDGDVVKGHYKLVQPDGRIRVVHYTADKHNGFNANVEYLGHAEHPSYYKYY